MKRTLSNRAPAEYTQNINFCLSPSLRLRIQRLGRRLGMKEGATVRYLLTQAIEQAEKKESVA